MAVADRNAPGIAEAMRAASMKITPRAMLSRGVSVIRGQTLIINLPGSPKAVRENLEAILPSLDHGLVILTGRGGGVRTMTDQFGRTINYMRVSVTDRCNLRCVYCMPPEGVPCLSHRDILTYDEITRVCRIGAGLGISRIKLTGGGTAGATRDCRTCWG